MNQPIKCGDMCYIMPHQEKCFCFLFTNTDDAFTFSIGVLIVGENEWQMRGMCTSLQRHSAPVTATAAPGEKKKRRSFFSFFRVCAVHWADG